MSRVQTAVVLMLVLLLFCHVLGLNLLRDLADAMNRPAGPVAPVHGIETTWRSASGAHRVWTVGAPGEDYRPWLAAHVAAFTEAQRLLEPVGAK